MGCRGENEPVPWGEVNGPTADGGAGGSGATGGVAATVDAASGGTSTGTAGGAAGDAGAAGAGGESPTCADPIPDQPNRPQLSDEEAAKYTRANAFEMTGFTGAPTEDPWDPMEDPENPADLTPDFVVAEDGSGTHDTVQAAISAATGSERVYILVEPGTYRGTVSVTSTKPPITLYGVDDDPTEVVIVDDKTADSAGGTSNSATMAVQSNDFHALNLTISNDFDAPPSGSGLQAVALKTTGDRIVLRNVRLHGFQDTLYLDSPSGPNIARVYIRDSFIEGDTDFVFGRGTAVIEHSTLHYLSSRKGNSPGIHLAPSTHVDQPFGFLIVNSEFTADSTAPVNQVYLGRSWDASSMTPPPNGQVVIRDSVLGEHIRSADPWTAAATSGREYNRDDNRLYEYCNSGPGAGAP